MQKGSLVIYKNQPALVTEISDDKYVIQYPLTSGKPGATGTQKIREKDAILLNEGSINSLASILELADNDELQKTIEIQLKETHELLTSDEESATAEISTKDLAELCRGSFFPNEAWAFYKELNKSPYFAPTNDPLFFVPRSEDDITKILQKETEKEKEQEIHSAFIARLKQKKLILPDDAKFMQEVEALALGKTDKSKALKEAGFSETPERAHKVLLDTGVWNITKNPHPSRHGLSMQSATEHLSHPPVEERLTVTHTAFAIDNPSSTDPDDAIAFDGEYVWVHIADPASTVFPDSKIDIAARNRGSTLYIPEGAARMLAEESLIDYALGLSEPENLSKALSFRIKLDETGAITNCDVFKTLVNVKRYTYEQADENQNTPELKPLFDIAEKNIERRKKAGAVFIELPEVDINIDKDGKVSINSFTHTKSSNVVREMMLLAGEAAAKFSFKNKLAFPFVSQDTPDIPKDIPEGLAGQYRLRRSMRSRSVGVTPSAHAGLGLGMYSQVTSPLRRYGDLVAHQQLRAFIDNRTPIDKDSMLERIAAGDAAASATTKAGRETNLHWTLVYLLQNPNWTGKAVCVELRTKQSVFLIPELGLETVITTGGKIELNDEILVKPSNINIPELTVNFQKI